MKYFAKLFAELDATTGNLERIAALQRFFTEAPRIEAAYGCFFLLGGKTSKLLSPKELRQLLMLVSGLPEWLIDESYEMVGDLAETVTLLLPKTIQSLSNYEQVATPGDFLLEQELSLETVADKLSELKKAPSEQRFCFVLNCWRAFTRQERFVFNKLITGGFRIGVQRATVAKALAQLFSVPETIINERLTSKFEPKIAAFEALINTDFDAAKDAVLPVPFYLAYPIVDGVESLGEPAMWQAEWKWDGIRAQAIKRTNSLSLWSRGEEDVSDSFPEIVDALMPLPEGVILDGEIVAYENQPLPFTTLQKRLNRISASPAMQKKYPLAFIAYDVLRLPSGDIRNQSLESRRVALDTIVSELNHDKLLLSEPVQFGSWEELTRIREESRSRKVEGLMLKHKGSEYGQGRKRGSWWKWKIEAMSADMVLIYAQRGHGRRAGLYTDFTFGVWHEGSLKPVAKAYSGLTDKEFEMVNRFIRNNSLEKFGPVRIVEPKLVMEIAFEGINKSNRHKSGVALRFPRMKRIREDKLPADADTLETLQALLSV